MGKVVLFLSEVSCRSIGKLFDDLFLYYISFLKVLILQRGLRKANLLIEGRGRGEGQFHRDGCVERLADGILEGVMKEEGVVHEG